jgi:cephalosporin hydroxylase
MNGWTSHYSIPKDVIAMQEITLAIRPYLIIETGIAHGGSLVFNASMLALLDISDAIESVETIDPKPSGRKVLGVDISARIIVQLPRRIPWLHLSK